MTSDALQTMRDAKDRYINHGNPEDLWRFIEAFEDLDVLLVNGSDLPEDWKLPDLRYRETAA
jgi:hypothetical protein